MKTKSQKLFLFVAIVLVLLFLIAGYSLIKVLYQDDWENNFGLFLLESIYLVMHLIFIAIIFYLNFRAYKLGAQFLPGLTITKDGEMNKKSFILSLVFGIIFLIIGVYSLIVTFNFDLPLGSFLGGLSYDLYNGAFLLFLIALEIFLYPILYIKKK